MCEAEAASLCCGDSAGSPRRHCAALTDDPAHYPPPPPLIAHLRCTDPEAELQQQHGRASLPLPVSARIRGVPASEQQGDSAVWQKQCAGAAGNCLTALKQTPVRGDVAVNAPPNRFCLLPVAEGRYGGRSRVSVPAPERRRHDPEVDAQSAHERLCRRPRL